MPYANSNILVVASRICGSLPGSCRESSCEHGKESVGEGKEGPVSEGVCQILIGDYYLGLVKNEVKTGRAKEFAHLFTNCVIQLCFNGFCKDSPRIPIKIIAHTVAAC